MLWRRLSYIIPDHTPLLDLHLKITAQATKLVRETVRIAHFGEKKMSAKKLELLPAKDKEGTPVDFVFVSGLGEDEEQAWKAGGAFWPQDFLQRSIPNARVLFFSFNQKESFSESVDRVCKSLNNHRRDTKSSSSLVV
ncbi:hypothetical protein F5X98DRAFT_378751 [Xylaria grammica]|nr:hypothetical protein F5X98DRAFT_378751 [Xylaria grammica]